MKPETMRSSYIPKNHCFSDVIRYVNISVIPFAGIIHQNHKQDHDEAAYSTETFQQDNRMIINYGGFGSSRQCVITLYRYMRTRANQLFNCNTSYETQTWQTAATHAYY